MFNSKTMGSFSALLLTVGVAALSGCAADASTDGDLEVDPTGQVTSAFVGQSKVPGTYQADSTTLRILNCSGGWCGVRTNDAPAAATLQLSSDNTWSCSGTDCTFLSPTGNTTLSSGTWAFPTSGDWRFIGLSSGGVRVATAKVGEWYTPGQATLTVSLDKSSSGVSGTYTQYVHFIHNL